MKRIIISLALILMTVYSYSAELTYLAIDSSEVVPGESITNWVDQRIAESIPTNTVKYSDDSSVVFDGDLFVTNSTVEIIEPQMGVYYLPNSDGFSVTDSILAVPYTKSLVISNDFGYGVYILEGRKTGCVMDGFGSGTAILAVSTLESIDGQIYFSITDTEETKSLCITGTVVSLNVNLSGGGFTGGTAYFDYMTLTKDGTLVYSNGFDILQVAQEPQVGSTNIVVRGIKANKISLGDTEIDDWSDIQTVESDPAFSDWLDTNTYVKTESDPLYSSEAPDILMKNDLGVVFIPYTNIMPDCSQHGDVFVGDPSATWAVVDEGYWTGLPFSDYLNYNGSNFNILGRDCVVQHTLPASTYADQCEILIERASTFSTGYIKLMTTNSVGTERDILFNVADATTLTSRVFGVNGYIYAIQVMNHYGGSAGTIYRLRIDIGGYGETDPVFTDWLDTNTYLQTESDPVYEAEKTNLLTKTGGSLVFTEREITRAVSDNGLLLSGGTAWNSGALLELGGDDAIGGDVASGSVQILLKDTNSIFKIRSRPDYNTHFQVDQDVTRVSKLQLGTNAPVADWPVSGVEELDPVYESEKSRYATGTPLYVESDTLFTGWLGTNGGISVIMTNVINGNTQVLMFIDGILTGYRDNNIVIPDPLVMSSNEASYFVWSDNGSEITITGLRSVATNTVIEFATPIPRSIDGKAVVSIADYAFQGCDALTSLTIPNSVTSIADYAFQGCYALTSLTIPNSVTSIGNGAFSGCNALTSLTIPDSVTSIADSAFQGCITLTSLTIPNSVTNIGVVAFQSCYALTSLTIPDSVTSIGNDAFEDCSALTSLTIPDSVTSIGDYAFSGCSSLTEAIFLPNSAPTIHTDSFTGMPGGYEFHYCNTATGYDVAPWTSWNMVPDAAVCE